MKDIMRRLKNRFLDEFYGRMHRYSRGTYNPFQRLCFWRKEPCEKPISHIQALLNAHPALRKLEQRDIFFVDHANCRVVISTELLTIFNEAYRIYHNDKTAINWFNIFREMIVIRRSCDRLPVISDIAKRPIPFLVMDSITGEIVFQGQQDEEGLDYAPVNLKTNSI